MKLRISLPGNVIALLFLLVSQYCQSSPMQSAPPVGKDPISVIRRIADKLVRETPFQYKLQLKENNKLFNSIQAIDFGRSLGVNDNSTAYAYTEMTVLNDTIFSIDIAHRGPCTIWINEQVVYKSNKDCADIRIDERNPELPARCTIHLKSGNNRLLIKNECVGNDWVVFLQPSAMDDSLLLNDSSCPEIGLYHLPQVDISVAKASSWLLLGPLKAGAVKRTDSLLLRRKQPFIGEVFQGIDAGISWTIQRQEVLAAELDPRPWGTNYSWNYHNGGLAWAMGCLAQMTKENSYKKYADEFCDFHLNHAAFMQYQINTLHAIELANTSFLYSSLLDFTLAPSLPFLYRLKTDGNFSNREAYDKYIGRMIDYAEHKQLRLPGSGIFTRVTPHQYTTWTDDMFMGIPFLVKAAHYVKDTAMSNRLLWDAASQVIHFSREVWDDKAGLYYHARWHGSNQVTPHWSRANGWAIWAITEVLKGLPLNHPLYNDVMRQYKRHVKALIALQDKQGFWRQVLDMPDSRQEVSGTAIFTMAIARGINEGWLNRKKYAPYAEKGWQAITSQIDADGTVHNICYGTMCSTDVNYYLNRPFYDNDTHGLFAVLFAGMEMNRLMSKQQF
ncbi:MAG TPA: glycoside hydrolase family 88 protein [Chitinophagaceae bacterium]|nr:glycoside hydrolase family 88 protein [Chitinophagaceae bacterium]